MDATKHQSDTHPQLDINEPKRRGPQPNGVPRTEVYKAASKKHRAKKVLEEGLVPLQVYIKPETKVWLNEHKRLLGFNSLGEVIDALAQQDDKK